MLPEIDPKLKWKVLESHYTSRQPWHTVRVDRMELPTGKIIPDYYVTEYPDWVNVIAVTRDDKLVMVQQYRHGLGGVFFEIPAGVCEKSDASFLAAAQRELLEETGFGGGSWHEFACLSANTATHNNLAHTFLAEGVEKISGQHLDEGEAMTVHLIDLNDVLQMLENGSVRQALMAAPLWQYFYRRRRQE